MAEPGWRVGLGRAVELTQRVGEAAAHRQNTARLVLQHDHRPLDGGADAQLRAGGLAFGFGHADVDDVVDRELASSSAVDGERQHPAIGQTDPPRFVLFAARLLDNHRGRPMDVVERQACIRQRLLPGWALVGRGCVRLDALDDWTQSGLRIAELQPAAVAFVSPKRFLQGFLDRPLQLRLKGRAQGVGNQR